MVIGILIISVGNKFASEVSRKPLRKVESKSEMPNTKQIIDMKARMTETTFFI